MRLLSVQCGQARPVQAGERRILTAIHKTALSAAVAVHKLGLEGDEQADLSVHGGLEKAVYAYPSEHYPFWQALRAQAGLAQIDTGLAYGSLGENLTLEGLLEHQVWVGDVLAFPDCSLRVTQPREPCFKFNLALGVNTAVRQMARSGACGFYLSVERPGSLQAGQSFQLLAGPRRVSIPERFSAKMFKHLR